MGRLREFRIGGSGSRDGKGLFMFFLLFGGRFGFCVVVCVFYRFRFFFDVVYYLEFF